MAILSLSFSLSHAHMHVCARVRTHTHTRKMREGGKTNMVLLMFSTTVSRKVRFILNKVCHADITQGLGAPGRPAGSPSWTHFLLSTIIGETQVC